MDNRDETPWLGRWTTRITVSAVFLSNMICALQFLLWPDGYTSAYELSGDVGTAVIRSFGVLFIMWSLTYPAVIWQPERQRPLFTIVLIQQFVGLTGELCIWASIQNVHAVLSASILRFVVFDGIGLVMMMMAFCLLIREARHRVR